MLTWSICECYLSFCLLGGVVPCRRGFFLLINCGPLSLPMSSGKPNVGITVSLSVVLRVTEEEISVL